MDIKKHFPRGWENTDVTNLDSKQKAFLARYFVEKFGRDWDEKIGGTEYREDWESTLKPDERRAYNRKPQQDTLEKRIASLHPWYYPVSFGNVRVTPGIGSRQSKNEQLIKRTAYRKDMLVDLVSARYDFKGKSLLDIASNCAYWSARYTELGAISLTAVEGRKEYVAQGELYWDENNFLPKSNYEFVHGNVLGDEVWSTLNKKKFDFSLCLGILYHIPDYRKLVRKIASVTKEAMLIDTRIAPKEVSVKEPGGWQFDAIAETHKKVVPSLKGLQTLLSNIGFTCSILHSRIPLPKEMQGSDNYNRNNRVCIFARRKG